MNNNKKNNNTPPKDKGVDSTSLDMNKAKTVFGGTTITKQKSQPLIPQVKNQNNLITPSTPTVKRLDQNPIKVMNTDTEKQEETTKKTTTLIKQTSGTIKTNVVKSVENTIDEKEIQKEPIAPIVENTKQTIEKTNKGDETPKKKRGFSFGKKTSSNSIESNTNEKKIQKEPITPIVENTKQTIEITKEQTNKGDETPKKKRGFSFGKRKDSKNLEKNNTNETSVTISTSPEKKGNETPIKTRKNSEPKKLNLFSKKKSTDKIKNNVEHPKVKKEEELQNTNNTPLPNISVDIDYDKLIKLFQENREKENQEKVDEKKIRQSIFENTKAFEALKNMDPDKTVKVQTKFLLDLFNKSFSLNDKEKENQEKEDEKKIRQSIFENTKAFEELKNMDPNQTVQIQAGFAVNLLEKTTPPLNDKEQQTLRKSLLQFLNDKIYISKLTTLILNNVIPKGNYQDFIIYKVKHNCIENAKHYIKNIYNTINIYNFLNYLEIEVNLNNIDGNIGLYIMKNEKDVLSIIPKIQPEITKICNENKLSNNEECEITAKKISDLIFEYAKEKIQNSKGK